MLEFRQLSEGTPPDIEVTTDDAQAELAHLTELFESEDAGMQDFAATENLAAAAPGEDGKTRFVIPGDEAGEVADVWNELATQIDQWNAEAIERAEADAAAAE